MRLEHIFVRRPVEAEFNGKTIKTSIFKYPVEGSVRVEKTNIEGDQQADLTVHGGVDKAVYAYPLEHYAFWKAMRTDLEFYPGIFGENLSVSGMSEQVCIGDVFKIGEAVLSVTTPRMPCYKLGIRMNDATMVRDFMKAERNGFYFKVLEAGEIEADLPITKISSDGYGLSVAETIQLYTTRNTDAGLLKKAVDSPSLPADWRDFFEVRLRKLGSKESSR